MRIGEITDVNVVAHTCPIVRSIVVTENRNVIDFLPCRLQHEGDQMSFRIVTLTSCWTRTGGVEVTQRDELQLVSLVVVGECEVGSQVVEWCVRTVSVAGGN